MEDKKNTIAEIVNKSLFIDSERTQPAPLITILDKVILTENNFITISGLPKSRKTTFMQFFIASCITGQKYIDIQANIDKNDKIVLIDTEQSEYDFYKQNKFLKRIIEKNTTPAKFSAYLFREYDPEIILASIYEIAETQRPKIIFIDNLTELAINPNDIAEAKKIIQFLKKLTNKFNLSVVCLLHLSKGGGFTLGNLGSYADRGAQSVLKVTLDKETDFSTLECSMLRSDAHFLPLAIRYSEDEKKYVPADYTAPQTNKKQKFSMANFTTAEITARMDIIFEMQPTYIYAALVENLKKVFGVGDTAVKQTIIPVLTIEKYIYTHNKEYHYYKNEVKTKPKKK